MRFEKPVSNTELVKRTIAGERSAFALLMARYRRSALQTAQILTRSDEAAREAIQEASLRAYLSLKRLKEPEKFGEWLRGIVRNVCRERLPIALDWNDAELEPLLPAAPDTALLASGRADDRAVREAVALLTPALRVAVQKFYFEGWSIEETATQLGIRTGAVKVRLHDARRCLKLLLEGQFPERILIASATQTRRKIMSVPVRFVEMSSMLEIVHEPVTSPETAQKFLMNMVAGVQLPRHALLAEPGGERFLSLLIESVDLGMALSMKRFDKFGLLDLTIQLMDATNCKVESVELQPLESGVLVAVLTVRTGEGTVTIEARPTDAFALVLKQEIPLRVATPLMVKDGWHIPDPQAIVSRILGGNLDEPFLVRLVNILLQKAARLSHHGGELVFEPREKAVWVGFAVFDADKRAMTGRNIMIPVLFPPEALPPLIARLKKTCGLDSSIIDREQSGETTVEYEDKTVKIQIQTTPNPLGETLNLRCIPITKEAEPVA